MNDYDTYMIFGQAAVMKKYNNFKDCKIKIKCLRQGTINKACGHFLRKIKT